VRDELFKNSEGKETQVCAEWVSDEISIWIAGILVSVTTLAVN
jgi:hypothetical protein